MSYSDLFDFCQNKPLHIRRNLIRDKVLELTATPKVAVRIVDVDTSVLRGFYISARNKEHPVVKQHGCDVIGIARDLNRCWQRFVVVKELMHLLSKAEQSVDSGEEFEELLEEFSNASSSPSEQMRSEYDCFWMALGVLCPEHIRQDYQARRKANEIDDYAIALELKIPQQYVPRLFEKRYEPILKRLRGG